MSDLNQITTALDRIFNEEENRIVFWHDSEHEFLDFIDANASLQFGDTAVQVLRLDKTGSLATNIRLEREDPTGRYLLYAPTEEPTMPLGLSLSERPNGEQIKRFRPLHRPNHPKQNRNFH